MEDDIEIRVTYCYHYRYGYHVIYCMFYVCNVSLYIYMGHAAWFK